MSTPADPVGLVGAFLDSIEPHADQLPDPFADGFTSSPPAGDLTLPVRLLGLLGQVAEEEKGIAHAFVRQRAAVLQDYTSRGLSNSTAYDGEVRGLFNRAEADRSGLHHRWYTGLSMDHKGAFDAFCLAVAGPVVRPFLPPSLPVCLHGPLARLALEYAAIVRRAAAVRREREERLVNCGLGAKTVLDSVSRSITNDREVAKSRLIVRWFCELTPEQEAAFDSPPVVQGGELTRPPAGLGPVKAPPPAVPAAKEGSKPDGPFPPRHFRWRGVEREFPKAQRRLYRFAVAVWPLFRLRGSLPFDGVSKAYEGAGGGTLSPDAAENYANQLSNLLTTWLNTFPARLQKEGGHLWWVDLPDRTSLTV